MKLLTVGDPGTATKDSGEALVLIPWYCFAGYLIAASEEAI